MLNLSDYPLAISQAAQRSAEIDYELAAIRQLIATFEGNADTIVAADIKLRNETQRRARRFEVLQFNPEYHRALDLLTQLNIDKANELAHLEYLRNQFTVAKLEARFAIAQHLAGLEVREYVGL